MSATRCDGRRSKIRATYKNVIVFWVSFKLPGVLDFPCFGKGYVGVSDSFRLMGVKSELVGHY